jgi:hypothetical protein
MNVLKVIFEEVDYPNDIHCDGCEFDEVTTDAFSTGDSPDAHNCTGDKDGSDCPAAKNELIRAYNEIMPKAFQKQAI